MQCFHKCLQLRTWSSWGPKCWNGHLQRPLSKLWSNMMSMPRSPFKLKSLTLPWADCYEICMSLQMSRPSGNILMKIASCLCNFVWTQWAPPSCIFVPATTKTTSKIIGRVDTTTTEIRIYNNNEVSTRTMKSRQQQWRADDNEEATTTTTTMSDNNNEELTRTRKRTAE